jgi:hypothetical protein
MRGLRSVALISLVSVALLVLPGCWVNSVHPLYQEDDRQPADPGLGGQWWQAEGDCRLSITVYPNVRRQFTLEYSVPSDKDAKGCAQGGGAPALQLEGTLVDLNGHLFLDLQPSEFNGGFQTIPTHSIFRVTVGKDELDLVPLEPEFVAKAIHDGKIEGLSVDTGDKLDELAITSRTSELRKFVLSVADDVNAFPEMTDGERHWHFTRMPAGVKPRTTTPQKPACAE